MCSGHGVRVGDSPRDSDRARHAPAARSRPTPRSCARSTCRCSSATRTKLVAATGWAPEFDLGRTLDDVLAAARLLDRQRAERQPRAVRSRRAYRSGPGGRASRGGWRSPAGRGAGGGPRPARPAARRWAGRRRRGRARRRRAPRRRRRRAARAADGGRAGARRAIGVDAPDLTHPPRWRRAGSPRCGSCPSTRASVHEEPPGIPHPVARACSAPRSSRRRARGRRRPLRTPRTCRRDRSPTIHTPRTSGRSASVRTAARRSSSQPRDREVALRRPGAAEVEREHHPPGFARDAVGEVGIGRADGRRAARAVREAVAEHEPEARARAACGTATCAASRRSPSDRIVSSMARLLWTHDLPAGTGRARNGPSSCTRCSRASRSSTCARAGSARTVGTSTLQPTRFWLYPTAEHQKAELLKAPYRHWIDLADGRAGRRADP